MDILDFAALDQAPLCRDPYEHVVVAGFVRPEVAAAIGRDFPRIADAGSYPIENVTFGPTFETFWQELQGDAFRERIARKFGVDLAGHPLMATVREHVGPTDGAIHTDSKTKVITVLIYFNEEWPHPGGRLRILRSATDLDDYADEVSPLAGTMVAFRRGERSFHGHLPHAGHRRMVQVHWVDAKRVERNQRKRRSLRWRAKKLLRLE